MIKRKVHKGEVRVFGRDYCVPDFQREKLEGVELRIDADGVIQEDKPELGLATEATVPAFIGWDYVATLRLKENGK